MSQGLEGGSQGHLVVLLPATEPGTEDGGSIQRRMKSSSYRHQEAPDRRPKQQDEVALAFQRSYSPAVSPNSFLANAWPTQAGQKPPWMELTVFSRIGTVASATASFALTTTTVTATALLAQLACLGPVGLVVLKELIVDAKVLGAPNKLNAEAFV